MFLLFLIITNFKMLYNMYIYYIIYIIYDNIEKKSSFTNTQSKIFLY